MSDVYDFRLIDVFQSQRTFVKAQLKKFPKCLEGIAAAWQANGPEDGQ